jgi:serine protease
LSRDLPEPSGGRDPVARRNLVIGRTLRSLCLSAFVLALSLSGASPAFAGTANTSAMHAGGHYDRFIVTFANGSVESRDHAARQSVFDAAGNASHVDVAQLRRLGVGADVVRTGRKLDRAAAEAFMRRLAANPRVASVELDALRKPAWIPNDPFYNYQWHYYEPLGGINLSGAWGRSSRLGSGVVVAVIDTGTTAHADLAANVLTGYDFISDAAIARDGNGRDANPQDQGDWTAAGECESGAPARDSSWHGTHVAGTIAAVTNNGAGLAGIAPNAKIVPARALGRCGGYDSDIIDAITWASGGTVTGAPVNANVAEVINLSLGEDGTCGAAMQAAIDGAVARGVVVVAAAGNDNQDATNFSPASCNNVVAVGSVGRTGARASYSNYGAKVDLSAPGGDGFDAVVSLFNTGTTTPVAASYAPLLGTSMAAPHVSGVVALMQSIKVSSPAAVEAALKASARAFPVACPLGCGAGILDANAALAAATPTLSIADVVVREGNSGTTTVTFVASLDKVSSAPVTFRVATADGSAIAGVDYVASTQDLTVAAGTLSKLFTVTINGDAALEPDETFSVDLSLVNGASVVDAQAIATIAEDDMTVSVADVRAAEGNSGTKSFNFLVSLSQPTLLPVTDKLYTGVAGGTAATAGTDFTAIAAATPMTVTIAGGQSARNAAVTVTGETAIEDNENFGVYLKEPVGAVLGDYVALGTIVNDDGPTISIANVAPVEGNSGTRVATFTVTLSQVAAVPVTYNIFTSDGTALAGSDYVAKGIAGETIPAGTLAKTFVVSLIPDTTAEPNEVFNVQITNASGASPYIGAATASIVNDDGAYVSMPSTLAVAEGQSGAGLPASNTVDLAVNLSQAVAGDIDCTAKSYDDTATLADGEYVAVNEAVTIAAGTTGTTIPLAINADRAVETDERMRVDLTCANLAGATMYSGRTWVTFTNDDTVPTLSVGDVLVTEGNAGQSLASFTVSLSAPTSVPVTFNVASANQTAASGSDYLALTSTAVTIPAGSTFTTVNVPVLGDAALEPNETFWLNATGVVGATVADAQGMAVIVNDEGPTLSVGDVSTTEGNSGTKIMTFTVSLSATAATAVTFNVGTVNGTATGGTDFVASTLTGQSIAAGTLSKTFSVTINGDTTVEPDETFLVRLTGGSVSISDDYATGTISDDDTPPALSLGDVADAESDGVSYVYVPLTLSKPATGPVTCDATATPGTATAGVDYDSNAGAATIAQGQTNGYLTLRFFGDHLVEQNETVTLTLNCSALANATILDGQAMVTIVNDDGPPSLSVSDATVVEGNSGTVNAAFTITPSWPSNLPITVNVSTGIELDATAFDWDFVQVANATVTIPANSTGATYYVAVKGDTRVEANEGFSLNLANPTGATIADGKGIATILNDDGPTLSINDVQWNEGDAGTSVATFTVALSQATNVPVTFNVVTSDGTALANSDYVPTAQYGVTIPAGYTFVTVPVSVIGDTAMEQYNETFKVNLSGATGATILDAQGTGTIVENDFPFVNFDDHYYYLEGDIDYQTLVYARLSAPVNYPITVRVRTTDGSASRYFDYGEVDTYVTIPAGNTMSSGIFVTIKGDNTGEYNIYGEPYADFFIGAVEATPGAALGWQGRLTIKDDDCSSCTGW